MLPADRLSSKVRRGGAALLAAGLLALLAYGARDAAAQTPSPSPAPTPAATPTPTPAPPPAPVNWQVKAGAGSGTTAIEAFLPSTIRVRQGDSVTWTIASDEIHTVHFFPPGQGRLPDGIPGPEPGSFQLNPAVFLPTDPPGTTPDVTGAKLVGSGMMQKGQKFTARFPQVGTFPYVCNLHPFQAGTVTVVAPNQPVPNQAEVDAAGQAELAPLQAAVEPLRAAALAGATRTARPDGTSLWIVPTGTSSPPNPAAPGNVDLLAYFPADITVGAGDTVRWVWGHPVPHTVTLVPPGEAPPPLVIPQPQPPGPPVLLLNPKVMAPAVPAGGRYDGTGYVNSGFIGPPDLPGPQPATFELTFTRAGKYEYVCILHLELGQKGTVTVQAPPALPVTGSAGPAQSNSLPWPWLALGVGGALLALAGLGVRRRAGLGG